MTARTPHTQALRDAVAAALRDAALPMSTDEVADQVGVFKPYVYAQLRALETAAVVERIRVAHDMRVFWRWTGRAAGPVVDLDVLSGGIRGGGRS